MLNAVISPFYLILCVILRIGEVGIPSPLTGEERLGEASKWWLSLRTHASLPLKHIHVPALCGLRRRGQKKVSPLYQEYHLLRPLPPSRLMGICPSSFTGFV